MAYLKTDHDAVNQIKLKGYIDVLCPTLKLVDDARMDEFDIRYYDPRFMLPQGYRPNSPSINMYKVPTCAVQTGGPSIDTIGTQVIRYSPLVVSVRRVFYIKEGRTYVTWQTHGLIHYGIDDIRATIHSGGDPAKEFALIETLASVLDTPARTARLEAHELARVVASTTSTKHEQRFAALFAATLLKDGSMPEWFLEHQHLQ